MSKQPEALRLAEIFDGAWSWYLANECVTDAADAAAELRRLHALNGELLDALKDCLAFLERDMPVASSGPERRKARAVIAKATGEQP